MKVIFKAAILTALTALAYISASAQEGEMSASFALNRYTEQNYAKQYTAKNVNTYADCVTLNKDGEIRLILPCESESDQYLTVKLNGSDTVDGNNGMLFVADYETGWIGEADNSEPLNLGLPDRRDRPELNFADTLPQFDGGFVYASYKIPSRYVKSDIDGSNYVDLRLWSTGGRNNYGTTPVKEQDRESRGIYAVYISEDSTFDPSAFGETVPKREAKPMKTTEPSSLNVLQAGLYAVLDEYKSRQIYGQSVIGELNGMFTRTAAADWNVQLSGADRNTYYTDKNMLAQNMTPLNGIELFAKAYANSDYLGIEAEQAREYLDRAVTGIDFLCRAQGENGGFYSTDGWIGAPERRDGGGNNLTGFGLRSAAQGMCDIYAFANLNELIDTDCDNTPDTERVKAWADMAQNTRNFLLYNPLGYGHAPNQDMADMIAALRFEKFLRKTDKDGACKAELLSDEEIYECLDTAFGFKPSKACYSYWVSPKGLILENYGSIQGGYSGDYGTAAMVELGQLMQLGEELVSDTGKYRERLVQGYKSIGNYYFTERGTDGFETLYAEGMTSSRNNYMPGTRRYPLDFYALSENIPEAVRIFRYSLAHDSVKGEKGAHFEDNAIELIELILNWDLANERSAALNYEFPMEDEECLSMAWADEMGRSVVIKNGDERLYLALQWRNPLHSDRTYVKYDQNGNISAYPMGRINNRARVHYTKPDYDVYGVIGMNTRTCNLKADEFSEFKDCNYIRGIMTLKYGDYYILMNATGLTGEGALESYSIKGLGGGLGIEEGVYADMVSLNTGNPVCYVFGKPEYTPLPNMTYLRADEVKLKGASTAVLCAAGKVNISSAAINGAELNNGILESVDLSLPTGTDSAALYIARYADNSRLTAADKIKVKSGVNTLKLNTGEGRVELMLWDEKGKPLCEKYTIKQ